MIPQNLKETSTKLKKKIQCNPSTNNVIKKHILASMIYFDSDMSKSTNTLIGRR